MVEFRDWGVEEAMICVKFSTARERGEWMEKADPETKNARA